MKIVVRERYFQDYIFEYNILIKRNFKSKNYGCLLTLMFALMHFLQSSLFKNKNNTE